jgi:hypothetical protein
MNLRETAKQQLPPCPFCGSNEVDIHEIRLSPTVKGPGALLSVTLRHHCTPAGKWPRCYIEMRGRDHEDAVRLWVDRVAVDLYTRSRKA